MRSRTEQAYHDNLNLVYFYVIFTHLVGISPIGNVLVLPLFQDINFYKFMILSCFQATLAFEYLAHIKREEIGVNILLSCILKKLILFWNFKHGFPS